MKNKTQKIVYICLSGLLLLSALITNLILIYAHDANVLYFSWFVLAFFIFAFNLAKFAERDTEGKSIVVDSLKPGIRFRILSRSSIAGISKYTHFLTVEYLEDKDVKNDADPDKIYLLKIDEDDLESVTILNGLQPENPTVFTYAEGKIRKIAS